MFRQNALDIDIIITNDICRRDRRKQNDENKCLLIRNPRICVHLKCSTHFDAETGMTRNRVRS